VVLRRPGRKFKSAPPPPQKKKNQNFTILHLIEYVQK